MEKLKLLFITAVVFLLTGCMGEQSNGLPPEEAVITVPQENSETPTETEDVQENEATVEVPVEEPVQQPEIDYLAVKPYEVGHIMIVMYHGIEDRPPYHRTAEDFIKDLQYMYDHGYRLISLRDYLDNHITVEAGYTPIVLTFDDGLETTFSLEEVGAALVVKPETAIGLLEGFIATHPDFGKGGALFINGGDSSTFTGAGTYEERLKWLVDHGYDIGNHLYSHPKLSELNGEAITEEVGKVDHRIKEALPGYTVDALSYPFGIRPKEEYIALLEDGTYEGTPYHYKIALKEGVSGPMVAPLNVKFDPYDCPRVRGSDGDEGDLWWWFDYYEVHKDYRYISDGNPDRVSVPKENEDSVNKVALGSLELYLY